MPVFPQWHTKLFPTSGHNQVIMSARSFAYDKNRSANPHSVALLGLEHGDPHGDGLNPLPWGPWPTYMYCNGHGRHTLLILNTGVTQRAGSTGKCTGAAIIVARSSRNLTTSASPEGIEAASTRASPTLHNGPSICDDAPSNASRIAAC